VAASKSQRFETPLLIAAARCSLRYIVLPFVLPLLGAAAGATLGIVAGAALAILAILDIIALIAIAATVRRLWRLRYPRWRYLPLAVALMSFVCLFFVNDARVLIFSR
jgi:hypothetical protein